MTCQERALAGTTGVDLIVPLYDRWIRFLQRAVDAIESRDVADRHYAVKRALDIVMHLEAGLRPDTGGATSAALSHFYAAMFMMTLEASHAGSSERLLQVIACVRNLRDALVVVARGRILPRELRTALECRPLAPSSLPVSAPPVVQAMHWSA